MPIHPLLPSLISAKLLADLQQADIGNLRPLEDRLRRASARDRWMQPYTGESGTKYYKSFVQAVVPRIIPAITRALATNQCPEVVIDFQAIDTARTSLGIGAFGSPQDVLYGFTSERYGRWGRTLVAMGFRSACMTAPGEATLTMAPRYLTVDSPDIQVDELEGAIPRDFTQSRNVVFSDAPFICDLRSIYSNAGIPDPFSGLVPLVIPNEQWGNGIDDVLNGIKDNLLHTATAGTGVLRIKAIALNKKITEIQTKDTPKKRLNALNRLLKEREADETRGSSQEQIALKFSEEGNFLQKILGGSRVDHIQSNVKMQKNRLKEYSCEVDAVYRVVGENAIVLVEAKDGIKISRTQLYQIYETFILRLPHPDWRIIVIAILGSQPTPEQRGEGFVKKIDLIEVEFDSSVVGLPTQSIAHIRPTPGRHFQWRIKGTP